MLDEPTSSMVMVCAGEIEFGEFIEIMTKCLLIGLVQMPNPKRDPSLTDYVLYVDDALRYQEHHEEEMHLAWEKLDADEDGYVTATELQDMMLRIGHRLAPWELREM